MPHFEAHDQNVDQQQVQNSANHGQVRGSMFIVLGDQGHVGFSGQGRLVGRDGNQAGASLLNGFLQGHQLWQFAAAADDQCNRARLDGGGR